MTPTNNWMKDYCKYKLQCGLGSERLCVDCMSNEIDRLRKLGQEAAPLIAKQAREEAILEIADTLEEIFILEPTTKNVFLVGFVERLREKAND